MELGLLLLLSSFYFFCSCEKAAGSPGTLGKLRPHMKLLLSKTNLNATQRERRGR